MKKYVCFLLFISILMGIPNVYAINNKISADFVACKSSEDIWLKIDNQKKRIRLLVIDSGDGVLNNEIDAFICDSLKNAHSIEIEYDLGDVLDKYNREMVWVYIDGNLLQQTLIKEGYGQVNYVTYRYNYLNSLCDAQKHAIENKLGIWNYENIEEAYCQSGVFFNEKGDTANKEKISAKKYSKKDLFYLIMLNAGILILILLFRRKKGMIVCKKN